jgi:hypothetical protein
MRSVPPACGMLAAIAEFERKLIRDRSSAAAPGPRSMACTSDGRGRVLGARRVGVSGWPKQRTLGRRRFSELLQLGYVGYQGAHSLPQERSARAAAGKCCLNGAAARNLYRV